MTRDEIIAREAEIQRALDDAKLLYQQQSAVLREIIGKRLREIREGMDISQEAMAALIGLGRQTVFTAELPGSAKRSFSVARLLEILTAYEQVSQAAFPRLHKGRARKTQGGFSK